MFHGDTQNKETYGIFEVRLELIKAIELAAAVQVCDFRQNFLQIRLRLLGTRTEVSRRPARLFSIERK